MQCIEGCLLYIPKYEIEAASGRLCRYQSMQEKLPVASSLHGYGKRRKINEETMCRIYLRLCMMRGICRIRGILKKRV